MVEPPGFLTAGLVDAPEDFLESRRRAGVETRPGRPDGLYALSQHAERTPFRLTPPTPKFKASSCIGALYRVSVAVCNLTGFG